MRVVRGFPAVVVALGALVVALVALVVALGGIAVGQAGSGGVGENGVIRSCVAQDGSLRVLRTGESCHSGERLLLLRAASGLVTENSQVAFASRTGKPRPIIRNRWTPSRPTRWPRAATPSPAPSGSTITAGWTGTRGSDAGCVSPTAGSSPPL